MNIQIIIATLSPLFSYPLNITLYPAPHPHAEVMICCHGYGGNATNAQHIRKYTTIPYHLLSFNFPDANLLSKEYDPNATSFGTIHELLPLLALIKACVVDARMKRVHLYGFSAGGGAVINALAALNTTTHDTDLATVGITQEDKRAILAALQQSHIILDCPLKSIEEIIALRGTNEELAVLAKHYAANNLRPIDRAAQLTGLSLTIMLYFQNPDEILSNRDDQKLYNTLLQTLDTTSTLTLIQTDDGGHNAHHASLWQAHSLTVSSYERSYNHGRLKL